MFYIPLGTSPECGKEILGSNTHTSYICIIISTMNLTPITKATIVAEFEAILDALIEADFNKSKAAEILQVDRKTLYNKLDKHKELGTAKLRKTQSSSY